MLPTIETVHEALRYRQDGSVWWRFRPKHHFSSESAWLCHLSRDAGHEAGQLKHDLKTGDMRVLIVLNDVEIMRARIVWALNYNQWAPSLIDHADRNGLNDSIHNLRLADRSLNGANRRKGVNNTSGYKGCSFDINSGKWRSQIRVNGRLYHLGRFSELSDAAEAYKIASESVWGPFAFSG